MNRAGEGGESSPFVSPPSRVILSFFETISRAVHFEARHQTFCFEGWMEQLNIALLLALVFESARSRLRYFEVYYRVIAHLAHAALSGSCRR